MTEEAVRKIEIIKMTKALIEKSDEQIRRSKGAMGISAEKAEGRACGE